MLSGMDRARMIFALFSLPSRVSAQLIGSCLVGNIIQRLSGTSADLLDTGSSHGSVRVRCGKVQMNAHLPTNVQRL